MFFAFGTSFEFKNASKNPLILSVNLMVFMGILIFVGVFKAADVPAICREVFEVSNVAFATLVCLERHVRNILKFRTWRSQRCYVSNVPFATL